MPRPVRPWFRFYVESFSDRKILRLRPDQRWLWTAILGAARESPTPGALEVAGGVPMTLRELARYADVDVRMVKPALSIMESLGMVVIDGDLIRVPNFLVRQYESDNVTARTRAFREREKEQKERSNDTGRNVPKNVRRNVPETETETETEKDSVARKRATRIDEHWLPTPSVRSEMKQECPNVNFPVEHKKFIDYWMAKSGRDAAKLDWDRTWRNWIRNAAERTGTAPRGHVQPVPAYVETPAPPPESLPWLQGEAATA